MRARADAWASADKRARDVSDWEGRWADQLGLALGGAGTHRWGPGAERAGAGRHPQIRIVGSGTDGCDGAHGGFIAW
jgi:hypothetical protein